MIPADWVPEWIVNILQKSALGKAVAWLKYESEKRANKPPSGSAAATAATSRDDYSSSDDDSSYFKSALPSFIGSALGFFLAFGASSMKGSSTGSAKRSVLLDPRNEAGGAGFVYNKSQTLGNVVHVSGQGQCSLF